MLFAAKMSASGDGLLSFAAICVSAGKVPVYTACKVSKLLPRVVAVTQPEEGAVHVHQTDAPPGPP